MVTGQQARKLLPLMQKRPWRNLPPRSKAMSGDPPITPPLPQRSALSNILTAA